MECQRKEEDYLEQRSAALDAELNKAAAGLPPPRSAPRRQPATSGSTSTRLENGAAEPRPLGRPSSKGPAALLEGPTSTSVTLTPNSLLGRPRAWGEVSKSVA